MRRILWAIAVVVSLVTFNQRPVQAYVPVRAYVAPWCAVISVTDGIAYWDCQYRSIEECRPNVLAGNRGWCNPNPYFFESPGPLGHRRRYRKHY